VATSSFLLHAGFAGVYNISVIRLVISTFLFVCLALPQAGPSTAPQVTSVPYETADAYEVYAAILPSEWSWKDAKAKRLVIRASTINYNMCLQPDANSAKLIASAIMDYIQQNQHPWLLQQRLTIEKPYVLLSLDQIESIFRRSPGGWEAFTQMYPDSGGIIQFSAVGFNSDKTIAVVYSGHSCGSLCGGGEFSVLQKKGGKWQPLAWQGSQCMWVS